MDHHGKSTIVTIFGSSRPGESEELYKNARRLGMLLAQSGLVVCNGGYGGVMEASARGAKEAGGTTIGVLTDVFSRQPNAFIDKRIVEPDLVSRLMRLVELGDAYVVLQGGTGTLLELSMVWELMNKTLMKSKPFFVMGEFWQPIITTVRRQLHSEGTDPSSTLVELVRDVDECAEKLASRFTI